MPYGPGPVRNPARRPAVAPGKEIFLMEREPQRRGRQGFASMDATRQREIASKGGSSVPPAKRPFARSHALAAEAGGKGGQARQNRPRTPRERIEHTPLTRPR
jgi:general stress protein YciG